MLGMACQFPGESTTLEAFWGAVLRKVDCVTEAPLCSVQRLWGRIRRMGLQTNRRRLSDDARALQLRRAVLRSGHFGFGGSLAPLRASFRDRPTPVGSRFESTSRLAKGSVGGAQHQTGSRPHATLGDACRPGERVCARLPNVGVVLGRPLSFARRRGWLGRSPANSASGRAAPAPRQSLPPKAAWNAERIARRHLAQPCR